MISPAPFILVRHAQSAANAGERTGDRVTIPITGLGRLQAQVVADFLPIRPALIVVSRYLRAVETAEPMVKRCAGVPVERWAVEEFDYLDRRTFADTTYAERESLRDTYWRRCDPLWLEGEDCECFAGFVARVRSFEERLCRCRRGETVVVFTHGMFMQALVWLHRQPSPPVTSASMADFDRFRQTLSVPNGAILTGSLNGEGRAQWSSRVSPDHLPANLRTG